MKLGRDVFTVGQVASVTGVSSRTVTKWFDEGLLRGYRIPRSGDRRVVRKDLIEFLKSHNLDYVVAELYRARTVLLAGLPPHSAVAVKGVLLSLRDDYGPRWDVVTIIEDLFTLGTLVCDGPAAAVVDFSLGGRDEVHRALQKTSERCERVIAILPEDVSPASYSSFDVLQHPCSTEQIVKLLNREY